MHLFRSHQDTPGLLRLHARLGLPENPVCWLLGHRPHPVITEWQYSAPSLWIACRVCGRRYSEPDQRAYIDRQLRDHPDWSYKQVAEDLTARRVANARRLPAKQFCGDVNRRAGWAERTLEVNNEVHWPSRKDKRRRSWGDFGFRLHVGGHGSETPFDGNVKAGPFAWYWSIGGIGHRLAHLLGRGHKRDLALQVHGGSVWWKLWYDDDGGHDDHHRCDKRRQPRLWPWSAGPSKYRSWMCLRDGSLELNPLNALWGHRLWHYDDHGPKMQAFVSPDEFPGDTYLVDFQLQRAVRHRDRGPAWARTPSVESWSAKWSCRPGIPVRNDDWKGDEILGSSENVSGPGDGWLAEAVDALRLRVLEDRRRYHYVPPRVTS